MRVTNSDMKDEMLGWVSFADPWTNAMLKDRVLCRYIGGMLMEAGFDTTSIFLQFLISCLVAFPEVQARAQKDIDRVIGRDRSPRFEDFDNLPYIDAIIKEASVPGSLRRQLTHGL